MRRVVWCVVPCILVLLVAACSAAPSAPAPTLAPTASAPTAATAPAAPTAAPTTAGEASSAMSFTDATGTTVTLPAPPARIACLTEICTDILAELGLMPAAVNDPLAEDPRFFGTDGAAIPRIGGSFFEPSLEDVAAAQPDLVIGLGGVHEATRDGLASIAPLYIMNPRTYADSLSYLADVGRLTGRETEAQAAAEAFTTKLERYRSDSPQDRSALIMWGSDVNFGIDTAGSLVGGLLSEVTDYPWPAPPVGSEGHASGGIPFSLEQVLTVNPAVLFIQTISFGPVASTPLSDQLAANPLWSELQAVSNGDVHEVSFSLWSTGRGTRSLGLILDEAMPLLYPETFPKPLP